MLRIGRAATWVRRSQWVGLRADPQASLAGTMIKVVAWMERSGIQVPSATR